MSTFYNIHDNPGTYFKEAIREIRCRIKLCELYCLYLDDFANIEDIYGKIIAKIGSNPRIMKDDWPVETNHILDQLQTATEKIGKQHIGYSLCISQSISRDFAEFAKSTSRRINELESKIQISVDEILKNSKVWKKKYGRYIRLIQDAEASIMSRDAAIREYAEKINSPPEEGFFNRSITMVLGKVAPNDSMKKQHDKCRALVHELDLIENDLSELTNLLHQQQEEYKTALSSALHEIEDIENERLNFIKTGLLRFYQANTGMSDHLTQIFEHLKTLISALDIHVDVEAFERELEVAKSSFRDRSNSMQQQQHHGSIATERKSGEILFPYNSHENNFTVASTSSTSVSPIPDISSPLPIAESTRYKSEDDEASKLLKSNLMIFDRLKDGIDSMKKSAQRATGTFAEISDAEKQYSKVALKMLEKHGYGGGILMTGGHYHHQQQQPHHHPSVPSTSTSKMISNSFVSSTEMKLSDLIHLYESTFCRVGWETVTQVIEKLSEAHLTVAEVLLDKCCVLTDNAQRKMETIVKDAHEKVLNINKKIDGAKATQMRLKSKLNRVQKELKDRRIAANSPRKALREETSLDSAGAGGGGEIGGETERLSMDLPSSSSNDQTLGHNKKSMNTGNEIIDSSSASASSAQSSFSMQRGRSEKGMIQGWESLGNAFGVVAVTALGAAGVLESSSERNSNRIANLEEEEIACYDSLLTASTSTHLVIDLCVNDLSAIIMSLKQNLCKEMENLKSSLMLFIDGNTVGLNISMNIITRLKSSTDAIDLQQDLSHFHGKIIVATLANEERKQFNPFCLPPIEEEFVRLRNDLVDLERLNEKDSQATAASSSGAGAGAAGGGMNNEVIGVTGASATPLSPTATSENRKSMMTTMLTTPLSPPRRQRVRGQSSEGEELLLTATSSNATMMTDEAHHTSSHESRTTPPPPPMETHDPLDVFPSEDVEPNDAAAEVKFTRKETDEKTTPPPPPPGPAALSSRSHSDSIHLSETQMAPLVSAPAAPSECSVPDYDEETLREVHSENSKTMTTTTTTSEKYKQDSHAMTNANSTLVIHTSSHEIGTFASSSQEGLRRSVTTEHNIHGTSDSLLHHHQMDDTTHTAVSVIPREETWASPELAKFDLPPTEKVLEYFSCALYPKRGLLTHGRLFITNRFLAFSGWPETRVILELQNIENVEKKQVFFIPNALSVNSNGEEYFFGSFLDRDLCYRMLTSMVMIAKSLNEITGETTGDPNGKKLSSHHRKNSLRVGNEGESGGHGDDEDDGEKGDDDEDEISSSVSLDSSDNDDYDDHRPYDDFTSAKYPDYSNLMSSSNVSCVYEVSTSLATSLLWRHCWQDKSHFINFLTSVGDFDILATDWIPFTSSPPLTKAQDPLGLKFQYKRTVDYLHPRTSMLMFGPKNATAKQIQYLSIPELLDQESEATGATATGAGATGGAGDISSLRKVRHCCILTATQFEGIPMSDVFEVLQYWTFQKVAPEKSMIRVGVTVNFLKGTLVKGQILAGTKEELTVLSKQWCDYSLQFLESHLDEKKNKTTTKTTKKTSSQRRKSSSRKLSLEGLGGESSVSSSSNHPMTTAAATTTTMNLNRSDNSNSNSNGSSFGQSHQWIILLVLVTILMIQTIFLYLLYRHIVDLDRNILELKSFLHSSLTALLSQQSASSSPSLSSSDLFTLQDDNSTCQTSSPSN